MRTKKIEAMVFILLAALLISAVPATAATYNQNPNSNLFGIAFAYKDIYNEQAPSWLLQGVGGQRVQGVVYLANGQVELINAVTDEGGKIILLGVGEIVNPSFRVTTTEQAIYRVIQSPDPQAELITAVNEGWVRYEVVGFSNRLRFGVATAGVRTVGYAKGIYGRVAGVFK